MKRQTTEWENIFANVTCDMGTISKIYKELIKLTKKMQLKMGKGPEYTLLQKGHTDGQWTYKTVLNITNHQRNAN